MCRTDAQMDGRPEVTVRELQRQWMRADVFGIRSPRIIGRYWLTRVERTIAATATVWDLAVCNAKQIPPREFHLLGGVYLNGQEETQR